MNIRVTVHSNGTAVDYSISVEPDAPLGELIDALDPSSIGARELAYLGGTPLDPRMSVSEGGIHDGAIITFGQPGSVVRDLVGTGLEVRVVGGPSAGLVFRIGPGRHVIGRHPGCTIPLNDRECSREHAVIELTSAGVLGITDLDSTNGTRVEGEVVTEPDQALQLGDVVEVGRSYLAVVHVDQPDQTLTPDGEGGFVFNRRYRIRKGTVKVAVDMPRQPAEPDKPGFPWIMAIAPVAVAGVLAVVTSQVTFLFLALMSPVMTIGSTVNERRNRKKRMAKNDDAYASALTDANEAISSAISVERANLRSESPDPALTVLTALGPRDRLWERRASDPDHLNLRIGLGTRESAISVGDASSERPEIWAVPMTVSLSEVGVLGIAAPAGMATDVGRWMALQQSTFHSPDDVRIVLLTDTGQEADWRWVEWLPHCQLDAKQGLIAIGNTDETIRRRIKDLQVVLTRRLTRASDPAKAASVDREPDYVVIVDGANRMRGLPGMLSLLQSGSTAGIYFICIDSHRELLPEECGGVVVYDETDQSVELAIHGTAPIRGIVPDQLSPALAEVAARALSPIHRTSGDGAGSIPSTARLLDALGMEPPDPGPIVANWSSTMSHAGTIGLTATGPLTLDLPTDGPHGLIAGTTGAGKSELLQTLVSGLAVANSPEDLNFVLVDYKGGAAFRDCGHLPHTVGLVTDLDGHLTERALRSLRAELKRREHVLAGVGAKDIDDYRDLRRRSKNAQAALPRLAIIIDEFASLVEEFPDFIKGLVGIAQLGRALGVHLILATQRPSGVVSPEIRANSNFAIALRVVNPAESSDIIGSSAASTISPSTPGRAYLRVSQEQPVAFQTARVGGRRPGIVNGRSTVTAHEATWTALGVSDPPPPRAPSIDDGATDLHALVAAIVQAAAQLGIAPQQQPWLDPLPAVIGLDDIPSRHSQLPGLEALALGIEDRPDLQSQDPAYLDITSGRHLLVAGSPRSGRTTTLRTCAASLARSWSPNDGHLYALDFGNGALAGIDQLPHCGALVSRTQADRCERLIARLGKEVERRQALLVESGLTSAAEQRQHAQESHDPENRPWPYVLVLLDNWDGFSELFRDLKDGIVEQQLLQLLRDGGAVGITFVISGDRTLLSASRVASLIEDKIVLRFNDRDDFALAGLSPKSIPVHIPAGRAFRAQSGDELQIALLDGDPSGPAQSGALARIAHECASAHPPQSFQRPFRVDPLPTRISLADATAGESAEQEQFSILAGVGGDERRAMWVNLDQTGSSFVILGSPESGRSTALLTIGQTLVARGMRVLALAPRQSPLAQLSSGPGEISILTGREARSPDATAFNSDQRPLAVLVDDAEDIDPDNPLLNSLLTAGTSERALIVAGSVDDVRDAFRGFLVQARKPGTGLLLSPKSHLDASIFGANLARGSAFSGPKGRGHLFIRGRYASLVQVPID